MKKIALTCMFLLTSLVVTAQHNTVDKRLQKEKQYCVVAREGKLVVIQENDSLIDTEIALNNGSRLTRFATLISSDGAQSSLQDGDCIDEFGAITKIPRVKRDKTSVVKDSLK